MSEQINKTVKTEESKGKDKSSSKEECSPVKASRTSSCDSPASSPSSDSDFHGFDGEEDANQYGKKCQINKLLDQLNASTSSAEENVPEETEKDLDIEEDKAVEVVPQEEEEEMTVDAGQPETATDSDSDQMEIDMGTESEKAVERTKDKESDVDVMETDSVTSAVDKSSVKEEGSVTESNGQAAEAPILESSLKGSTNTGGKTQPRVEYCGVCSAEVDDEEAGICCDGACERWFHLRCSGLTQEEYDELSLDENAKWACSKCSGRPPPVLNPEAKPLLTVRKDLTKVVTPLPKRKSMKGGPRTPKIDISNPAFLKPFDFGWKRELVYRSTNDDQNRRQGDIYYYTPKGKKLRSLREISEHLGGTDLTQDNFTFWKEPLGIDDPDKEIIRDAKFKSTTKDPTASPSMARTPKTPKPPKATKVTPKLTATVTPLDTSGGAVGTPKVSASVTPRIVLKGKTQQNLAKFKVAPSKNTVPGQAQKIIISKGKKKGLSDEDELEMGMLPPMWEEPMPTKPKDKVLQQQDVCSISCLPAMGVIPTLQCHVCLCLYHPECVGLKKEDDQKPIINYKCKNCQLEKPKPQTNSSKTILAPPPLTPISSLSSTSSINSLTPLIPAPPKLQRITDGKPAVPRNRGPLTKTSSIVGGVTTWLPPSSTIQMRPPPPAAKQRPQPPTSSALIDPASTQPVQTLVSMDCKRYIVVPKHNVLSVSPATTTSSVQVADPSNVQITTAASDPSATMPTLAPSSYPNANIPILPKPPQVTSSATFIVGSPTVTNSFQNPPGVLLVPYLGPQMSPTPKDGQQPQYIVVNGPSGLPSGNFIIGNIPQQQQLKLPTVPTSQPTDPPPESPGGAKRPLEAGAESPVAKRVKIDAVPQNFMQNVNYAYGALLHAFQYLKVQELLRCSRVCHMWRDIALHKCLWETVRMKNSQVKDWEGFSATMRRVGARHLDLRKILMPDKQESLRAMWTDCVKALSKVNTLVKLDLCRCASTLLEQIAAVCPQLEVIAAGTIKSNQLNMTNLGNCQNLQELKLKSVNGMEISNVAVLANLTKLKQLSLTTVKNMNDVLEVVGKMGQLESLELGEILNVTETVVSESFSQLTKLRRLRLEKGQNDCPTDTILQTISKLPSLVQLELINFDVKAGFEESLALCTNIKILLIIPTYVTQSATTNHLVIEGVSKLSKSLNHFVWGLTLELLRVTDLFIDQWEMGQKNSGPKSPTQESQQKKSKGDSIPILKPTNKDGKKSKESAVTQVDVLQLPKLHKVLTTLLPTTKIIILKVPFSATWRQTISNSTQ